MQQPAQRGLQQREHHLGLRVTEARVELDHPRAGGGDRQPDVEQAGERGAPAAHLRQRRVHHVAHHVVDQAGRGPGQRRVRAHAAGVRPGVAVADPLEVLRRQQRHRRLAVGDHEEDDLRAVEVLLDHHPPTLGGVRQRGGPVVGHHHALAGGEPVVLHHVRRAELVQRPRDALRVRADVRAGRSAHRRRSSRPWRTPWSPPAARPPPDGPNTAMPLARTASATPATSGASGPITTRSAAISTASAATAAGSVGVDRPQLSHAGDPRITRRRNQRGNTRIRHQTQRKRVLPPATTHQKNPHARDPTVPLHPTPS